MQYRARSDIVLGFRANLCDRLLPRGPPMRQSAFSIAFFFSFVPRIVVVSVCLDHADRSAITFLTAFGLLLTASMFFPAPQ